MYRIAALCEACHTKIDRQIATLPLESCQKTKKQTFLILYNDNEDCCDIIYDRQGHYGRNSHWWCNGEFSFGQVSSVTQDLLRKGNPMIGTYVSYRSTIDNMSKTLDRIMTQPNVKRETDYYTQNIKSVKTVDDFLNDTRLFNYAMKAYGLEDMSYAKGMMRKVLTDADYATGLVDKRYQQFAAAFNFSKYGENATSQDSATKVAVNKYMQQTLETQVGDQNEGTRLALYFTRTVGGMVKNNTLSKDDWAYQLIADKALSSVVFTALGVPDSVRGSDVEGQKRLIESRLSYDDMADPAKLEKFIGRFSAMYDAKNQPQVSPALTLLQSTNSGSTFGFSNASMIAMQSLKPGGN